MNGRSMAGVPEQWARATAGHHSIRRQPSACRRRRGRGAIGPWPRGSSRRERDLWDADGFASSATRSGESPLKSRHRSLRHAAREPRSPRRIEGPPAWKRTRGRSIHRGKRRHASRSRRAPLSTRVRRDGRWRHAHIDGHALAVLFGDAQAIIEVRRPLQSLRAAASRARLMATLFGCALRATRLYRTWRSVGSRLSKGASSTSCNTPVVSVPVLSNTTRRTVVARCRTGA